MDKYKSVEILKKMREDGFVRGRDCDEDCINCKKVVLNENKDSNTIGWFPCGSKRVKCLPLC